MMAPKSKPRSLTFNCWIHGLDSGNPFPVHILPSKTVGHLKIAIKKEEQPTLEHISVYKLGIWKLRKPLLSGDIVNTLGNIRAGTEIPDADKLDSAKKLSSYFPKQPVKGKLHLVVQVPPSDVNLGSSKKRKLSADDAYIHELRALPAPSEMATNWKQSENNPTFLNHRPYEATGIPTVLMHPAFGQFFDDYQSITLSPEDFRLAHHLADTMAGYFPSELDRLTAFAGVLQTHASLSPFGITLTDTAELTLTVGRYIVLNVEAKNEPWTGGNPSIQNLGCYANQLIKSPVSLQCRMPAFLVSLEGPRLSISTAAYGEKIITDPTLLPADLDRSPHQLHQFSYVFAALFKAIQALKLFYEGDSLVEPSQRPFPYLNSFHPLDSESQSKEKRICFTYASALFPNTGRLLFVVNTTAEGYGPLLVKFCRQYGKEAHLKCGELGIAPKLAGFEHLAGGWFAAVMERLPLSFRPLRELTSEANLEQRVTDAAQRMHHAGFVHGDLRDTNILVDNDGVKIVDWNWSGRPGEIKYPISINLQVPRAAAVRGNVPIVEVHDMETVRLIFQ